MLLVLVDVVLLVLVEVLVVVLVVVVVAGTAQPVDVHASQQLGKLPTQALPPFGGLHTVAVRLRLHFVTPVRLVRQQVTVPALPHVDFEAHFTTAPKHDFDIVPPATATFAASTTHRR